MPLDGECAMHPHSQVDALQWMEAPYDARALSWAREATRSSTTLLQGLPSYGDVLESLTEINATTGQVASIGIAGPRAIRLSKSIAQPRGILEVASWDGVALGDWRTVFDVGAFNESEGKDVHLYWDIKCCLAPHFERCLLALHEAGGDEAELREFDLITGQFVEGGFAVPKSRCSAVWLDADTLLLAHTIGDAPKTVTGWPATATLWRRGTPFEEARVVFRMEPQHALMFLLSSGEQGQAVIVQAMDYSTFALHLVTGDQVRSLALPTTLKMVFGANADHVFAVLAASAMLDGRVVPAESVIAMPLKGGDAAALFEVVHVPKQGEVVNDLFSLAISPTAAALSLRRGIELRVDIAKREKGIWQVGSLIKQRTGVSPKVVSAGLGADGFVIMSDGFLTPPVQEWVGADGSERITLDARAPAFDTSRLEVDVRQAISQDGQVIDFLVVGPREHAGGSVPTLMTGYGAFGLTISPAYFSSPHGGIFGGASLKIWLERGGALAVPALRGGGEHGAAWHDAAKREKRQRSYDDFHAVAQALIDGGYTDRRHLGVFGLSNGGLLAAVAGTQRPDLYGAIVSDVPLADMLRFPEMGMGAAWIDEYGDPDRPADATWLAAYSPVHNVKPGVDYPTFLVTVATTDNRVGPGHARKLAKRLMDVGASAMFLEPEGGGHGVSDPLQQPEVMAMRSSFFINSLMNSEVSR